MKNLIALLILVITPLFLTSFKKTYRLHELKLKLNDGYNVRLIDSAWLEQDTKQWKRDWTFDINDTSINYRYDSLATGNYTFWARDVFGHKHKQEFRLSTDTCLSIVPMLGYKITDSIPLIELQQAERIEIVYNENGCFTAHKEMLILTRDKDKTTKLVSSDEEQQLYNFGLQSEAILQELYELQLKYKEWERTGRTISTTNIHIYIIAADQLFQFEGYPARDGSNFYQSFKRKYLNRR